MLRLGHRRRYYAQPIQPYGEDAKSVFGDRRTTQLGYRKSTTAEAVHHPCHVSPIGRIVFTMMIIGPPVLRWIFSWKDPSYWFDVLPIGEISSFKTDSERLDRLGVMAGRYSIFISCLGFLTGLVLPVLRHVWLAGKHHNASSA